jgi:hypothetical protein
MSESDAKTITSTSSNITDHGVRVVYLDRLVPVTVPVTTPEAMAMPVVAPVPVASSSRKHKRKSRSHRAGRAEKQAQTIALEFHGTKAFRTALIENRIPLTQHYRWKLGFKSWNDPDGESLRKLKWRLANGESVPFAE